MTTSSSSSSPQSAQNVQPPPTGPLSQHTVSSSVVLKSLSFLLGLFFIFIGAMKISPFLSKDLHKDLRKEYVKYSKVFPLSDVLDLKIPSKWYRRIVGGLEVGSGIAMALIPHHKIKNAGNITLLALMFLSIYNHYMVSDAFERIGPALVFTFMLTGRLVVWYQISRREAKINAAAQAQANGLKQD